MQEIDIVDALRTPFGSFGGSLAEIPAPRQRKRHPSTIRINA